MSHHETVAGADDQVLTPHVFPQLDAVRALAAAMVVATHAAFWTGHYQGGVGSYLLTRLDSGVALFFVLSAFLLSRPYFVALANGTPAPRTRPYLLRRAARILPAYWAAVALALLVLPENRDAGWRDWVSHLTLTQIYHPLWLREGLTQTWSLCTEVSFYLVLPVAAWWVTRVLARGRWDVPRLALGLLSIGLVTPVWILVAHWLPVGYHGLAFLWLPEYALWFGAGAGLALLSVYVQRTPGSPVARRVLDVASAPGWCWLVAGCALLLAATPLAGPRSLISFTVWETLSRVVLYAVMAVLVVLPLSVGPQDSGPFRQVLSLPFARWAGERSYGLFLYHLVVIDLAFRVLDQGPFSGNVAEIFAIAMTGGLLIASVSYRFLEMPVLRWAHRRTRGSGPRPGQRVAVTTSGAASSEDAVASAAGTSTEPGSDCAATGSDAEPEAQPTVA